jgi:hypothetical protein
VIQIVAGSLVLVLIIVVYFGVVSQFSSYFNSHDEWVRKQGYNKTSDKEPSLHGRTIVIGLVISLALVFILLGLPSGSTYIKATEVGVLENTLTGQLSVLSSGTYIFPFTGFQVIPFISKVTKYSLQRHIIEIGEPDGTKLPADKSETQFFGVPSASNSPGQPIVYFRARGWAYPNVTKIMELHRRYGANYQTGWVEAQWTTALKNVQRTSTYDAVKNDPIRFQAEVEESLQDHLDDIDGVPIVLVSQLAILDYDYDTILNDYLQSIANKGLEKQVQEQQFLVNQLQQQAEIVKVQTTYSVTLRTAEAESARLAAEASGRATATKLAADADAYRIMAAYTAEASGIAMVIKNFGSVDAYNHYKQITEWDGKLPQYWMGGGVLPFFNVPVQ